ncbi:hypothetical protein IFVP182_C260007 [Vibrio parahaemolyticus]
MKPILELMIYKNIGFYEGKYSKYANNSKIEIIDDRKKMEGLWMFLDSS